MSLKEAREAISKGELDKALEIVDKYQEAKGPDYNALLLQGNAYQRQGQNAKAENAYKKAVKLQPDVPYAYKGLCKLYNDKKDWSEFLNTVEKLLLIYEQTNDITAATDEFQRAQRAITASGGGKDFDRLLKMQLPDSPIYPFLKGRMMPLPTVLQKLIIPRQRRLKDDLARLASKSKMSLSATPAKLAAERVKLYQASQLDELYQQLLAASDDDDQRRAVEGELLGFQLDVLVNEPALQKPKMRDAIKELADGMVLFTPQTPEAFLIHWDWQDIGDYAELDKTLLVKFCELFPGDSYAHFIDAFLHSPLSPFPVAEDDTSTWTHQGLVEGFSDGLAVGYGGIKPTILALRMSADLYLQNGDYEQCVEMANEGLRLIAELKKDFAVDLPTTKLRLSVLLGTAYVHFQPPKNFALATKLFDFALSKGDNLDAVVGKAQIQMGEGKLSEAKDDLAKVVAEHPTNVTAVSALAWCEVEEGLYDPGREHLQAALALVTGTSQQSRDHRAQLNWRIGYSFWQQNNYQAAFDAFVAALQQNPSYGPAYTYLGLFYDAQGDKARATRCYYKALEINNGEIIAGERLATNFAAEGQWDLVEIVASRVLDSDRSDLPAWPYRALGIVSLSERNWSDAVKYFQKCLRLAPDDANSWVGLGEAYTQSGRFHSAYKALQRALSLDPKNLSALYTLSVAQRETLHFADAAESLVKARELDPHSPALVAGLVDSYVRAATYYLSESYLGDATDQCILALEIGADELEKRPEHSSVWSAVAVACQRLLEAQGHLSRVPRDVLVRLWEGADVEGDMVELLERTMLHCFDRALETAGEARASRACAQFNLALGSFHIKDTQTAIGAMKRAITLEPRNDTYWNLYGIVLEGVNARVSQHCFIRSLGINGRSPLAWANLGLLYVSQGDIELASEAFDRALSVDPDSSSAWLGQALVEYLHGKSLSEVNHLFEHAYLVSPGNSRVARLIYGICAYQQMRKQSTDKADVNAVLALEQLLQLQPHLQTALLLSGLVLERAGDFDEAIVRVNTLVETLSEVDASDANTVARLHSRLARLYLGKQDFAEAISNAQAALDAGADNENVNLCALLVLGLGNYFSENFDAAVEALTAALEYSEGSQDVVILVVQVLFAHGGEDERQVALDNLYASIDATGSSLRTTLLLGVIGLLSDDHDTMDAVREELRGLTAAQIDSDRQYGIPKVLSLLENSKEPYYRAIFRNPAVASLWAPVDAGQALLVAKQSATSCNELSGAYAAAGGLENARRAVFYAPGVVSSWQSLAQAAAAGSASVKDLSESTAALSVS